MCVSDSAQFRASDFSPQRLQQFAEPLNTAGRLHDIAAPVRELFLCGFSQFNDDPGSVKCSYNRCAAVRYLGLPQQLGNGSWSPLGDHSGQAGRNQPEFNSPYNLSNGQSSSSSCRTDIKVLMSGCWINGSGATHWKGMPALVKTSRTSGA